MQKEGVTEARVWEIYHYFRRALKAGRLLGEPEHYHLVEEAEKLLVTAMTKDSGENCQLVQAWVDKYVTLKQWQRCIRTLHQRKSRKKLALVTLNLPVDIYFKLKVLSKEFKLGLKDTINQLANAELNRLTDKEVKYYPLKKEMDPKHKLITL